MDKNQDLAGSSKELYLKFKVPKEVLENDRHAAPSVLILFI